MKTVDRINPIHELMDDFFNKKERTKFYKKETFLIGVMVFSVLCLLFYKNDWNNQITFISLFVALAVVSLKLLMVYNDRIKYYNSFITALKKEIEEAELWNSAIGAEEYDVDFKDFLSENFYAFEHSTNLPKKGKTEYNLAEDMNWEDEFEAGKTEANKYSFDLDEKVSINESSITAEEVLYNQSVSDSNEITRSRILALYKRLSSYRKDRKTSYNMQGIDSKDGDFMIFILRTIDGYTSNSNKHNDSLIDCFNESKKKESYSSLNEPSKRVLETLIAAIAHSEKTTSK